MRLLTKHISCLLALTMLPLCGCVGDRHADESPAAPLWPEEDGGATYLRLAVSVGAPSRATGGEAGDATESGLSHESAIDNLSIFIFNDPTGAGLDAPAATPISFAAHYDAAELAALLDGGAYCIVIPKPDYEPAPGDYLFVAANTRDITGARTLGVLQQELVDHTYQSASALADCRSFAMVSADNDGALTMDDRHDGSRDLPYAVSVALERLAARIDFLIPGRDAYDDATGSVSYPVADAAGATVARVHLTHILPVNLMQGGTFLLKRVTATAPETPAEMATEPIRYCGVETTATASDGQPVPTNYVVEPRTLLKEENGNAALPDGWFGASRAANIDGNAAAFTADHTVAALLTSNGGDWLALASTDGSAAAQPGIIVSYADENTCHRSLHSSEFITGLALRVVYQPSVVYADANLATQVPSDNYAPNPATGAGQTLYRYCPDGLSSREANCRYFSNAEAADAYLAAHPAEHATVQTLDDGVCYYNLWLSHATPSADTYTCPMQYAIVRNNIYRVSVAFTGPGVQPPEITDVKPGNIDCRIYVRKWNAWTHPEILI